MSLQTANSKSLEEICLLFPIFLLDLRSNQIRIDVIESYIHLPIYLPDYLPTSLVLIEI